MRLARIIKCNAMLVLLDPSALELVIMWAVISDIG